MKRRCFSSYYLAAAAMVFSRPFAFPLLAAVLPAIALVFTLAAAPLDPEPCRAAAASCEALRRMLLVKVVRGGSTGTVGARTDSGCLDGATRWGDGLSVLQWAELRLRRVPKGALRGARGLPGRPPTVETVAQEDEDLGGTVLDFR